MTHSMDFLLAAQRALRSRFDDFARAARRNDAAAAEVGLHDFEQHLVRWTEAEEKALIPALTRVAIPGRDPRRELRLEYVQIRELTRYILSRIAERVRPADLLGYIENLDRRLKAHESGMESVYYPVARGALTDDEWQMLESA